MRSSALPAEMPLRILAYAERVRTALDDMLTRSGESHPELLRAFTTAVTRGQH
jgi:hypothetical protein